MAATSRTTGRRRRNSSMHNQSVTKSSPIQKKDSNASIIHQGAGVIAAIMVAMSTITTTTTSVDTTSLTYPINLETSTEIKLVSNTEQPESWEEISQQSRVIEEINQQTLDSYATSTAVENQVQKTNSISYDNMNENKQYFYLKLCLAGGFASCLAHGLLTPLDMIKTRMQTSSSSSATKNPLKFAQELCQTEGPMTLLKGFQSTLMGYLLGGAVAFGGTEFFTRNLFHNPNDSCSHSSFTFVLLCGAISVFMADIVVAPFEALRIRTVTQQSHISQHENDSANQKFVKVKSTKTVQNQEEGTSFNWIGLYTGFPALVIKDVPFHSIKFAVYDTMLEQMHSIIDSDLSSVLASVTAGIAAAIVSQPADAALTHSYTSKTKTTNTSPFDAFVKVWEKGTMSNGLLSRCVFAAILVTIQFTLYSTAKNALLNLS